MQPSEKALSRLVGRCTGAAGELVRTIGENPALDEILAVLAHKEGTITELDVTEAIAAVHSGSNPAALSATH